MTIKLEVVVQTGKTEYYGDFVTIGPKFDPEEDWYTHELVLLQTGRDDQVGFLALSVEEATELASHIIPKLEEILSRRTGG